METLEIPTSNKNEMAKRFVYIIALFFFNY